MARNEEYVVVSKDKENLILEFIERFKDKYFEKEFLIRILKAIFDIKLTKNPKKQINPNDIVKVVWNISDDNWEKFTKGKRDEYLQRYRSNKNIINNICKEEFREDGINPDGIIINKGNLFCFQVKPGIGITVAGLSEEDKKEIKEIVNESKEIWQRFNCLMENTMPKDKFKQINNLKDHSFFDDKDLAFLFITSVYYSINYSYWFEKVKDNKLAIKYLIDLLAQPYQRGNWRAGFLLQFVDKKLLNECLSEMPKKAFEFGTAKDILKLVKNKTVVKYIKDNLYKENNLLGPHARTLYSEFIRF